ncbi:hypothetical protein HOK021_47530 [Streptomyces hygroscopicus]|nr:hypothetical protein HOK021_47530 [Streptomyces hygroscopicus]
MERLMVAAVPSWAAVSVAVPEPKLPQSNETVAVSGVTAVAAGAIASVPATATATPSAVPIPRVPDLRCLMGVPPS